jgi:transposase InsO family protein
MNHTELELLIQTRNALVAARHGGKGAVIAKACELLQCDEQTVYRKLQSAGLDTGRKARSDKGNTMYTREHLTLISGMLIESTRRTGKQLLTVEDAVDILHASNRLPAVLSAGRVAQLLRDNVLHPEQLSHQAPAVALRSLHPNHVWQLDASICVLYYIKGSHLQSMPADEFYKNKPHNLAKVVNDLCGRYAMTDHYSGTIWTRYYPGGESAANLLEFFMWAAGQREDCPAHGVPFQIMMDPGAANTSHVARNLFDRLGVKLIINEPGNARAKGQVEQAHNIVERHFEGRLAFMPSLDLDQLNELCERWQLAYNSSKRHSRHGQPRFSMWMRVTPEQLRIAPPLDMMRELVTTREETRRVSNTMTVSYAVKGYGSRDYDVRYVPGVLAGQTLKVVVNPYRAPAIDVQYTDAATGELAWICVEPQAKNEAGFVESAPVIGADYHAMPNTVADTARNDLLKAAYGVTTLEAAEKAKKAHAQAYAGQIDPMADVNATEVPAYLPRRGTALDAEKRAVAAARVSCVEAAKRIKAIAGDAYDPKTYGWLAQRFGDEGVPEDQIEALAEQLLQRVDQAQAASTSVPEGLRAVGGRS